MTATLAGTSTVGVLRVGTAQVAVTLDVLREVLPCPEQLEPLPAAATGLLGAINVRGSVVPVVDLRPLLGWPAERGPEQIVTVVNLGDRVIGLLCDEVLGVARLVDGSLQQLADTAGGLLFSHSFERSEDGRIVSLLDIERLLSLPGVPAARPRPGPGGEPTGESDGGPPEEAATELVVIRCGAIRFGLDVACVHALLPKVDLSSSPLVGPLCIGVTGYGQRQIPAVHLLHLVGLADTADAEGAGVNGGLIIRYPAGAGDGYVALLLSEVIEIVRVADARLLALPAVLASVADWFHGLVALPGIGDVLVLDPARLTGNLDLAVLAALNTGPGTNPDKSKSETALPPGPRSGEAEPDRPPAQTGSQVGLRYLTYSVGYEVATPLLQVSEIITYPEAWTPIRRPDSGLLGVFTHRGGVVPLVCLASLLGGEPTTEDPTDPDRRVVIVTVPGGTVGFTVPVLTAIEVSTWEEAAPQVPDEIRTPAEAASITHVIRVGSEGRDRNLRTLDLAAVATALTAATEPADAQPTAEPAYAFD